MKARCHSRVVRCSLWSICAVLSVCLWLIVLDSIKGVDPKQAVEQSMKHYKIYRCDVSLLQRPWRIPWVCYQLPKSLIRDWRESTAAGVMATVWVLLFYGLPVLVVIAARKLWGCSHETRSC